MRCGLFLGFVFLISASLFCAAQSNYATVRGTVTDTQDRAIASAMVVVSSVTTSLQRSTTSNADGIFEIPGLQPGNYTLRVEASGFALAERAITLEVGQQLTSDFTLKVGAAQETIKVTAAPDMLKPSDSSVGEVVDSQGVSNLPLNGRMLIDLVLTVPGAHEGSGAQTGEINPLYWRPGQPSAVSISGNRPNANYFLLDGTVNTDPTFNTQNFSPSPDAVQEFKVQTSSYTADMGGAGGGQINIVTRSGTSQFHGTFYDFMRNGALDAHTFNAMGSNQLVQNEFGGSLGGPMGKKTTKTFFFLNYEGLRMSRADTMIETVPTSAERAGDFSQSGVKIYNPLSARPNPNYDPTKPTSPSNSQIIRTQFPGNVIPASTINQAALTFLQSYVPLPNFGGGMGMTMMGQPTVVGSGVDSNNYMDIRDEQHYADQGSARIDHIFRNNDSLMGRYSISSENGFMPVNLPGFGFLHDNLSQQGVASWTHLFSPTMVNIAAFTVSRLSMNHTSQNNGVNDIVSQLGIQGVGFGGQGAWGAPYFNVQGYSGMGDSYAATPMHAWDTMLEARDGLSWQKGRHSLKFGGSYRYYIWPMWGFFQNRGYYQFTNGFTTQTATNDGTGSALASFLLGLPAVAQRQAGVPQMNLRNWSMDGYVHDTFLLTRNTTLNFGLRYEYQSPLVDQDYTNTNLTFESGIPQVFIGGQNGYPAGLQYANKNNLAPRIGIAQNFPAKGLVWHAAYGVFFTPIDFNTWCNQRHNVPYVFPETKQSDNFIPSIKGFNFAPAVLGKTVVSFTAFDPHAPSQYIQEWNTSLEKSLGNTTTLEVGYLGAHGVHLQRAHLINNAPPGPGLIGPRRPYKTLSFVPDSVLPPDITVIGQTFSVSTINLLENTASSWYDALFVNVRHSYSNGFSLLANYTWAKSLTDAPDFRSPMAEASIPQNNNDLEAEKGPACDLRHRFAFSAVYDIPSISKWAVAHQVTQNWQTSAIVQVQSGYPFTISVFGDTANSGTVLGENPIRANYTSQPIFGPGTRNAMMWFNPAAFATPPAYTFGDAGRNSVYGPGLATVDLALQRRFGITERTSFQIRGEFFNALNHTNLGIPNRFVNTPQFGTITEAATPGREIQLSARFSF